MAKKTNRVPGQTIPKDIDDYIAGCSPEVQPILAKIRATVRKAAPRAIERISYRMPAFGIEGDFIYFAAFKKHIGLFPPVRGDAALLRQIARYQGPKGNLRFPLDEPMPYTLITKIVKCRLKEHLSHLKSKHGRAKK